MIPSFLFMSKLYQSMNSTPLLFWRTLDDPPEPLGVDLPLPSFCKPLLSLLSFAEMISRTKSKLNPNVSPATNCISKVLINALRLLLFSITSMNSLYLESTRRRTDLGRLSLQVGNSDRLLCFPSDSCSFTYFENRSQPIRATALTRAPKALEYLSYLLRYC